MAQLLNTEKVEGPTGVDVRVRFYDDGSIRVRVEGTSGPWVLEEAFLAGSNDGKIVKLSPRSGKRE